MTINFGHVGVQVSTSPMVTEIAVEKIMKEVI